EEISPEGPVRDGHWKQLEEAYKEIGAILDKNGLQQSWVAGGSGPTMADFLVSSYLTWIKVVDPKGWASHVEKWENGRWERFMKKFDQWTTVL
ncbi:MAG TPA: glutathione S-transferase C-terminal domain-containing protein, partial [Chlamydiales bacterium]|nr:glutathione S-transferase C-terminal domain-containing protein [Chlamydiales bacterium]